MKLFDSIQVRAPKLNKFNLSHERKLSLDMGQLIPIMVQEVIPGDIFRVRSEMMARLAPLLAPMMHRVNVKTESFFVPNRIIWSEFEDFITGGRLGDAAPVAPFATITDMRAAVGNTGMSIGSLADHMGLPYVGGAPTEDVNISMLPFRAYQKIYDEYYRDQNLMAPVDCVESSGQMNGGELTKLLTKRMRCWEKDYFTSALPFAQRGAAVTVPFGVDGFAPVQTHEISDGTSATVSGTEQPGSISVGYIVGINNTDITEADGLQANLGEADLVSSVTINDLRRSVRLQEWLELSARAGGRYVEHLRAFWNQISDDARLQRPEFLGGSNTPFRISEVLSTVQQVDAGGDPIGTAQGDMTGHGMSVGNQAGFKRRFKEHGFVIVILSILPRTGYQQGIHRMWTRSDKFDYAFHQFANIGEQEVKNMEVYFSNAAGANPYADTFGYQSRYAEYKYACSTVHGDFKGNLDFWHMNRIFAGQPALDAAFVQSDPTDRVFAVQMDGINKIWCHVYNQVDVLRPLPYFGTPSL